MFRSPRIYVDLSISSWLEDSLGLCCSQTAEAVGGLRGALVNACFPSALSSALVPRAREFVYPYHTPQEGIDMLHSLSIPPGLFKPLFLLSAWLYKYLDGWWETELMCQTRTVPVRVPWWSDIVIVSLKHGVPLHKPMLPPFSSLPLHLHPQQVFQNQASLVWINFTTMLTGIFKGQSYGQVISSSALVIKSAQLANYCAHANNISVLAYEGLNLAMVLKTDESKNQH